MTDKMNCCQSTRQQNLGIAEAHLYCPACGAHWWRGKLYRRAECELLKKVALLLDGGEIDW